MSFNVKRQLLGAAGAGGGGAYFVARWTQSYDADKRNTIHAVVDSSDNIYVDFDYKQSSNNWRTGVIKFDSGGNVLADRYLTNTLHRPPFNKGELFTGTWYPAVDNTNGKLGLVVKSNSFYGNLVKLNTSDLTFSSGNPGSFPSGNTYGFQAASGNSYLVGGVGFGSPYQGFVAKFNSSNTQQWSKGLGMYDPYYSQKGVYFLGGHEDSSGNVYIGGLYPYLNYEALVVKLNSSGSPTWYRTRKEDNNNCLPVINVDSSGNVYAAGTIGLSNGAQLAYITKWNSSGTFQWDYIHQYDDQRAAFQSIDFDSSGNVYVAGSQQEDPNGNFAGNWRNIGCVVKLNSSGTVQWQRGFANSTATNSVGQNKYTTVAIDSNDDMILSTCESDGTNVKFYLLRLPNDGTLTGSYGGVGVKYDSTGYGDKAVGSSRTPVDAGSGNVTRTALTNSVGSTDISYSVSSQTI